MALVEPNIGMEMEESSDRLRIQSPFTDIR